VPLQVSRDDTPSQRKRHHKNNLKPFLLAGRCRAPSLQAPKELLQFKALAVKLKKVQVCGCYSWRRCRTGRTRWDVPAETPRGYLALRYSKCFIFQRHGNRLPLDPKRTQWLMLGRHTLAIGTWQSGLFPPTVLHLRPVSFLMNGQC